LAPEQLQGAEVDARADVWALGVILHELIAGELPFGGETLASMLLAVAYDEPAKLAAPPEVAAVVRACLAKEPGERPADVRAVARALAGFAGEGGVGEAAPELEAKTDAPTAPLAMTVPITPVALPAGPLRVRLDEREEGANEFTERRRGALTIAMIVLGAVVLLGLWSALKPAAETLVPEDSTAEDDAIPRERLEPLPFVPPSFMFDQVSLPAVRSAPASRDDHGFTHPARLR
jgi:serine/threonine-protein kinase